ncbi:MULTISPECIES: hypothetical protein [Burkholderia]|jgi:hypothetical protein|nr:MULTISPECIES: hypothetical protein [Burkholderia]AIO43180.1 hypothetical protein DM42_6969 [Burkholderia cepacia]MBG0875619.1 hypothetical protein [Burkholderia sp. 9775_39]MBG0883410.1 hypothetical protein [Burkholderia sp. 9773_38]MBR7967546.1 hypothetical protein [Burkholderia cenocepacia]MBR8247760.1 hypothetical protein [Burkholderia cenocepacia]
MNTTIDEFFKLAAHAEFIAENAMDQPLEPALEVVLSFVQSHLDQRFEFATAFLDVLRDPEKGPPELVEYCMHELKWPEVREAIQAWLDSERSERVRHVLRKQLLAFDENWYDANFYDRFKP